MMTTSRMPAMTPRIITMIMLTSPSSSPDMTSPVLPNATRTRALFSLGGIPLSSTTTTKLYSGSLISFSGSSELTYISPSVLMEKSKFSSLNLYVKVEPGSSSVAWSYKIQIMCHKCIAFKISFAKKTLNELILHISQNNIFIILA